jgi:peptide/nickel transport system permease protein
MEKARQDRWILLKRLARNKGAVAGAIIVLILLLIALFAPQVAPYEPDIQNFADSLKPPSSQHPFGTDKFGRDILSRVIYGSRISLQVGMISVGIGLVVGMLIGVIGGLFGGLVDRLLMGLIDLLLAFPGVLLAIGIVAILGPGLYNVMIAVGIRSVPTFARLVRGQVLDVKQNEYVESARALGSDDIRIIMRHIIPNIMAPVLVISTLRIALAILSAAALSFLGLGAQPPTPDWGAMIANGREYLRTAWWVGTFPGIAIMLTVLGFNMMGDGLRDVLDPRLKT